MVEGLRILMKLELIKDITKIDHSLMQNELQNLRGGYGSERYPRRQIVGGHGEIYNLHKGRQRWFICNMQNQENYWKS